MKTTMKRFLSMLLCLILTFSFLGLFTKKASAANRTGAEMLDGITTSYSKKYVLHAIDIYLTNTPELQNSWVVFMFEGASANPASYENGGERNQAIAVVVNCGEIIIVDGNCSTIPDCPDCNYGEGINYLPSSASVKDGIYKLIFHNTYEEDTGTYRADFQILNKNGTDYLPCIRLDNRETIGEKNNPDYRKYKDLNNADGILIHNRTNDYALTTSPPRSAGCMLVGKNNAAFNSFHEFLWDRFKYTSGYFVLNRHLAVNALDGYVYGLYSDTGQEDGNHNAVELLTAGSKMTNLLVVRPPIDISDVGVFYGEDAYNLRGSITSASELTSLTCKLYTGEAAGSASGDSPSYRTYQSTENLDICENSTNTTADDDSVWSHSYSPHKSTVYLNESEMNTEFRKYALESGCYTLIITAENADSEPVTKRISFAVGSSSVKPTISLDSIEPVSCGFPYDISGTVSSPTSLTSVKGEILSGSTVMQSETVYPNTTTLNLMYSDINYNLRFGTLASGNYTLRITAVNDAGTTSRSVDFTVGDHLTISLDSIGIVACGSSYNISGTVSSSTSLTSVKGEILLNNTAVQSYTVYPNSTSLDLKSSAINTNLRFGTLDVGRYTLKITAVNLMGTATKSVSFSVVAPIAEILLDNIGTVSYGSAHNITGTVRSSINLTSVTGQILRDNTTVQSCTVYPNAKTLDLVNSSINYNLRFGMLAPGSYKLKIIAVNATGTASKSVDFTVYNPPTVPTISLDSIGTVPYGSAHNITGTVTSQSNLTSVKGEILSGSTVKQSYTVYPNATTLNLLYSNINYNLRFSTLAPGSYTLKITAVNSAGMATKSVSFTVRTDLTISLNSIGNVSYGRSCNISGTVSSGSRLTSVKGEILSGNTVKQSCTVYPNATTLNLLYSNINYNLRFGILARGTYTLRITATDASGATKIVSITFRIV